MKDSKWTYRIIVTILSLAALVLMISCYNNIMVVTHPREVLLTGDPAKDWPNAYFFSAKVTYKYTATRDCYKRGQDYLTTFHILTDQKTDWVIDKYEWVKLKEGHNYSFAFLVPDGETFDPRKDYGSPYDIVEVK